MVIGKLVNSSVNPLRPTDSVQYALDLMNEYQTSQLPVVDPDGFIVGLVWDTQLDAAPDGNLPLNLYLGPTPVTVSPETHIFDVTKLMVANGLDTLAIAEDDGKYVGCVQRADLFGEFAWMLSTHASGAILTLEVGLRDYALSKLIHTIEQSDVKVLSVSSEKMDVEGETILLTLKLNTTDTTRIRHVLEHHGYKVVGSYNQSHYDEELHLRVQEFMRYLEV